MNNSTRLHDLSRPWRFWIWGEDAIEVPPGVVHEDVAEKVLEGTELPYGRTAASWLLERGAVKQWDLHFITGAKVRESLRAVQQQLWEMVAREKLTSERLVMLSFGGEYALSSLLDVLAAKSWNDLTSQRGKVRENPSYLDVAKRDMAQRYGSATTENPNESGFLLADGTWLKMGMDGSRGDDHRTVTGYVRGKLRQEVYRGDRWNALVRWQQVTGSIRWNPETCSFDIHVKPTPEQLDKIWRMCRRCEETTIEQTRGKKNETRIYTPPERDEMVSWIREFWR